MFHFILKKKELLKEAWWGRKGSEGKKWITEMEEILSNSHGIQPSGAVSSQMTLPLTTGFKF